MSLCSQGALTSSESLMPSLERQSASVDCSMAMAESFCHAGAGSDADKVVEYRAFARMRRAFPQAYTSYEMGNFSRFMIKAGNNLP